MADATQYKAIVAWRSIANKVVQLTKATESTLATYRVYVSPIDRHDVGSGQVESGFYFISYMGNPYLIIAVGTGYVDVEDSFRFRKCPTSGKNGIVYKSVGDGDSPYLAPFFRFLHPTAFQKFMGIALDILWKHSASYIEPPLVAEYQDFIAGTAKDYVLLLSAIYPFTIDSFWAEVDDGTIDVSLKIVGTAITGIDAITVDTTAAQIDATALNSVAVGNRVIFSLSTTFTGTPTLIRIQIKTTRL